MIYGIINIEHQKQARVRFSQGCGDMERAVIGGVEMKRFFACLLASQVVVFLAGLATVVGLAIVAWVFMIQPRTEERPAEDVEFSAQAAVDLIVRQRDEGKYRELPVQLRRAIAKDPRPVVVYLVLAEARKWPGLSDYAEAYVLKQLAKSPEEGLESLRYHVFRGVRRMETDKKNPAKEPRHYWNNNNRASADIFVRLPVAERLGKVREFVTSCLEAPKVGARWYEPELSFEQFVGWSDGCKWPFPGEKAPHYDADEPRE